jgi:hypothetical protein
MRMALLVSLGIGVPASTLVALLAHPIMAAFGAGYAATAATALSILALTFVTTVVRQLFVALSRLQGRSRRATGYAIAAGVGELLAAWYGAAHGGLTGLAACLAAVFVLEGLAMAPPVLRVALARPAPSRVVAVPQQRGGRHAARRHRVDLPTQRRPLSDAPTIQFRRDGK